MKIRLAIVEKDANYLNRIVSVFSTKFTDKIEAYSFTDLKTAMDTIQNGKIDILLASDAFEIDINSLPRKCGFAYFVDSPDIDTINSRKTICKYQKADMIYKQLLSIYSESAGNTTELKLNENDCKIIAFSSPDGGTGNSTMAAACALHFAAQGMKTLYLNLELYGSADVFFSADGQFSMTDVIFALKSKKTNLALKLESCVKQDNRGVYFYSQSQLALDMLELTSEEITTLISELSSSGQYDYIILDCDFGLDKAKLEIYNKSHAVIFVGDGTETSNMKIYRAYNALLTKEQGLSTNVSDRVSIIYNKFSNKSCKALEDIDLRNLGGAPRYEHATSAQILSQLYVLDIFDTIIG